MRVARTTACFEPSRLVDVHPHHVVPTQQEAGSQEHDQRGAEERVEVVKDVRCSHRLDQSRRADDDEQVHRDVQEEMLLRQKICELPSGGRERAGVRD